MSMKIKNIKKNLLIIFSCLLFAIKINATTHTIYVWSGYFIFVNGATSNNLATSPLTVQLGDTIQFLPLDPPTMMHTVTSTTIPAGATAFDQIWQLPADTFFQYVPAVVGVYNFECTPHVSMNMIGSFTVVSNTVGINQASQKSECVVFPNPTVNSINLNVTKNLIGEHYFLSDLNGKIFFRGELKSVETLIDLNAMHSGNYILSIGEKLNNRFNVVKE
jgi:plastocyanin